MADWLPFEGETEGWGTTEGPLNYLSLRRPNPFFTPLTPTMQYAEGELRQSALHDKGMLIPCSFRGPKACHLEHRHVPACQSLT